MLSKMKAFLEDVVYTTAPVPPDSISSLSQPELQILWVGCSDSPTIETASLNVPRHQLFVHRDLGNKLSMGDTSSLATIEVCVETLQVKHIIICGHYGCGLINASSTINSSSGWLSDLNELRAVGEKRFGKDIGVEERNRRLVELNVLSEVRWTMQQPSVMKAVRERGMEVHGFVCDSVRGSCVKLEISW